MFIQKCFVSMWRVFMCPSFTHQKLNHIPQMLNDILMGPGHSAFMLTCPLMAGCQRSNRLPQHLKASEPESTTNFKSGGRLPLQSTLTSWQWRADLIQTDRGCRKDCQVIKAASPCAYPSHFCGGIIILFISISCCFLNLDHKVCVSEDIFSPSSHTADPAAC